MNEVLSSGEALYRRWLGDPEGKTDAARYFYSMNPANKADWERLAGEVAEPPRFEVEEVQQGFVFEARLFVCGQEVAKGHGSNEGEALRSCLMLWGATLPVKRPKPEEAAA